ncbi:hypothetical protein CoNPh26_CDS0043 [Staphylococcus phage S-CoN_Ph26]|nr:hypothetical protein CoNPh26_CDS0043 [Staphylococcus phage S-CoN_Ph26]
MTSSFVVFKYFRYDLTLPTSNTYSINDFIDHVRTFRSHIL